MTSAMLDMTQAENHLLSMEVTLAEDETSCSILLEGLLVQCKFVDQMHPC